MNPEWNIEETWNKILVIFGNKFEIFVFIVNTI